MVSVMLMDLSAVGVKGPSAAEQLADDVAARQEPCQLAFAGDGELLDILVDHHVRSFLEAEVLGNAQHGSRHDVLDAQRLCAGGAALQAGARNLRQESSHDV